VLNHPWGMMLVRIFCGSNRLGVLFDRVALLMEDGWEDRTRNEFLYTYMHEYAEWERRTVDQVMLTYLHTRSLVKDHIRKDEKANRGERGEQMEDDGSGTDDEEGGVDEVDG